MSNDHNPAKFKRRWFRLWTDQWRETELHPTSSKRLVRAWRKKELEVDYFVVYLVAGLAIFITVLAVFVV